jgi:hypothetical protein
MFQPKDLEIIARQQYEERLHEAEQRRLIHSLDPQADPGDSLEGARYWLGDQMIKWGHKLQRYQQDYKGVARS